MQRQILTRYHVTDAAAFYNGEGFWEVPEDPGAKGRRQPPYYQSLQMPGGNTKNFSLTTVYNPRENPNLAAFMAIGSTPGRDYGQIQILQLPRNSTAQGPGQVQNSFETDPKVKNELFALRQGGTRTVPGNMLTIPFAGGMLYVEPMYAMASGSAEQQPYPLLGRVLVRFGDRIASGNDFGQAMEALLGQVPSQPSNNAQPPAQGQAGGQLSQQAQRAIDDLEAAITAYEKAQKELNYAEMGKAWDRIKKARDALAAAQASAGRGASPSPSPSPSGSPSPTPSPSTSTS
jgi:uncharacterized membrane protein (UPF0182 family)